ncbi:ArsR family transcriptional regulator [Gordoniibacillus kamchatkensis]|uniref:ArsR family transcriptional regulator n=1 Tax=Gordoniibacillus kamchatkensis TaxID=1590651 RepID=A0ABR5ANA6_9BACL|nr:winged helix-turn-helix transcriptional regulator [Paenibacillus sp. VKM B-2647]KIL42506.1 ArsR family transcriptional regulator [Paenibacillus sp. VKM B-2647]
MIHIKDLKSGLGIFKALSSDIRLEILELLNHYDSLNLNEIAEKLGLSNGAITMHIKKLEQSGLIGITTAVGKHGIQKICYINEEMLTVELKNRSEVNVYDVDIRVGHYIDYYADPTCGLATKDSIIGEFDNPRYFADPQHINAGIVWLSKGFLEYRIPNYLKPNQSFNELQFIMELGSEAPSYNNDYPSDIVFYVNNVKVGAWTSPGDFGGEKGKYNPDWWPLHLNQNGLLKLLRINENGTFIDGWRISDVKITDVNLKHNEDIKFKIGVAETGNVGGLTIYGKNFGNYNQDLIARVLFNINSK